MNVKQGFLIAIFYIVFRFLEMKFIDREMKPMKPFFKDGLMVFFSVLLGTFALSTNSPLKKLLGVDLGNTSGLEGNDLQNDSLPPVFTNQPNF
tara:strand:- start:836 stop:1114 length:279 start_codon:yes stop_codon:yes gene_type:complete